MIVSASRSANASRNFHAFYLCIAFFLTHLALSSQVLAHDSACRVIKRLPVTINQSGNWCLEKDLRYNNTTGAAIEITRHNVVLDLNGYRVSGSSNPATDATGIRVSPRSNVQIVNGVVERFRVGVQARSGRGLLIEQMKFDTIREFGVHQTGTAKGTIIRENVFANTGRSSQELNYAIAINIDSLNGSEVTASNIRIVNNTISEVFNAQRNEFRFSFGISANASTVEISGNTITNVLDVGIFANDCRQCLIDDNYVATTIGSFSDSGGTGLRLSLQTVYRNNVVQNYSNSVRGGTDGGGNFFVD